MSSFEASFGARLVAPDRTRFRLWAPGCEQVSVEIEGMAAVSMQQAGDGWFVAEAQCGTGARYKYRVSSGLAVPDPASRAQAGDVHDASIVCDPDAYQWKHADWNGRPWHETVLLELHAGTMGGFEGVAKQLPLLAELGITAIELMPVADFPGPRNWGYDGVLHYAPDAAYGSPEQLKALVDTAHGLGMMVFLDVVYNHFGPDGNYLGTYAPQFFRDDIHTPWGQAIDFRKQPVRDFFTENAIYWLDEFRFDGLRFDAVHAISDKDWLVEMAQRVRAAMAAGRHVHLVLENDDNSARLLERAPSRLFDAQWNDDMHHILHVLLTGEREGYYGGYVGQPAEKLARGLAEGFIYQGEAALLPGGPSRGEPSAHLPPTAFVFFLQNHDQIGNRAFGERLTVLAQPQALRAAMALQLMSPQIPMLFMGEESGATQPFLYFTSHLTADLAEAVRNGRRQEFARFAAFSDPALRERIPDPNDEETFQQSIPHPDPDTGQATREWIASLLAIRRTHIVPRLEGARSLGADILGPAAVAARWRMGDGQVLVVSINLGAAPVPFTPGSGTLLFATEGAEGNVLPAHAVLAILEPSA
ncbi:malto-oligosyltrehalose trehalohydrolase [Noviherbaspirillum denitrificans]|uniref:Malto-oligosyltrehalose trehalohydrolase n=1 Tax=Noviherbaspirillum denitrificans TaxID=1968433 RepID=A0A254TIC6_9BURK|nr:malto-oligosyltrehalose trehalohydrolase [Noviherbaspirillum denitrificans]OWW22265.1 malto-oligosyltrehalose trehalohydrolase [Noviherbaspirillum denitrificans]